MTAFEIEAWALRVVARVKSKKPDEDSRIELKRTWPDKHYRAARRIAGHANLMHGEPILWLIGLDETEGVVGASKEELANWWPQVQSHFDGIGPDLIKDINVDVDEHVIVALAFSTDRFPYLVKNPSGDAIRAEVPWREGTSIRTAKHGDLLLMLSTLRRPVLRIEIGDGPFFLNPHRLEQGALILKGAFVITDEASMGYYSRLRNYPETALAL
jgi:hypothetical protein